MIMVASIAMVFSVSAHASILSVTAGGNIIGAPSNLLDDDVTNKTMQGFDEAQGVTTSMPFTTDSGVIGAGSLVDSHMIFLNSLGSTRLDAAAEWTFSGVILGIMSDRGGNLEAASTFELGAAATNYTAGPGAAPFGARGLESNNGTGAIGSDGYLVLGGLGVGNVLRLSMHVTEPGDWIRVITASVVPVPAAIWLFGTALVGFLGFSRRRNLA